uniref:(California timema) hypothetical protein n=1 Tax=Timema californicum TaxID=61474 RepID=A0A7R9IZS0_TIMCA|nr:unnamed protein product [Timema californicum]
MERDEISGLKLDEEFRKSLLHIKPFVYALSTSQSAKLCASWLQKLNNAPSRERVIRNAYLVEMCKQAEKQRLSAPFNNPPPAGPLRPLLTPRYAPQETGDSSEWSDATEISETTTREQHRSAPPPSYFGDAGNAKASKARRNVLNNKSKPPYQPGDVAFKSKPIESQTQSDPYDVTGDTTPCDHWRVPQLLPGFPGDSHSDCMRLLKQYEEQMASDKAIIACYQQFLNAVLSGQGQSNAQETRESSQKGLKTCDKALQTSEKSLQASQKALQASEKKISSMKATIKNLQAQNAALSADRDRYQKSFFAEETKKAAANVNLSQEIATLQEKLADLTDAKASLESSHKEAVSRYQHLMDINVGQLRKKLAMAQGENQRIQAAITALENKLQELETEETEKEKFRLEQWQDKVQKEVLIYNQKLVELEEIHSMDTQQLGAHIDDLTTKLTLKDNEVKGLQLQMKTQYMSLSTAHAQGKNQEMEQAVAQLEAKYLDLLGNIKDSAWKQKENDQKSIAVIYHNRGGRVISGGGTNSSLDGANFTSRLDVLFKDVEVWEGVRGGGCPWRVSKAGSKRERERE